MRSSLLHIYGPLSIHSFGLMIALGILVFSWCVRHHPSRKNIISDEKLFDALLFGTIIGIIGARILYLATNWDTVHSWFDIFTVWQGGLSMLGATIAALTFTPIYLVRYAIAPLPFLDIIALYAPLLESICRVGCWLAGCCFGKVTTVPWAMVYNDPNSAAPLGIPLHPTQLYASLVALLTFIFIYRICQRYCTKPGQLLMIYLVCSSFARLNIDFFRNDQEFFASPSLNVLSVHQWIALVIMIISSLSFIHISFNRLQITYKQ